MSERTESVIKEALSLSPVERAEVIERLYESMRSEREKEIEQAWAQESERRIDELQSGEEATVPFEQMKREMSAGDFSNATAPDAELTKVRRSDDLMTRWRDARRKTLKG